MNGYGHEEYMVWFANEPVANQFITNLVENINNYSGENWIDMYPEKF